MNTANDAACARYRPRKKKGGKGGKRVKRVKKGEDAGCWVPRVSRRTKTSRAPGRGGRASSDALAKEKRKGYSDAREATAGQKSRLIARNRCFLFNERQWGVERLAHLQYRRMQVQARVPGRQEQNFVRLFSSPPRPAMQPVPVLALSDAPPPVSV